jgi:hypothetical protein
MKAESIMDITFESSTNALATDINTADLSSISESFHEHRSAEARVVVSESSDDSYYCGFKVVDRVGSMIQLTKWSQELKDKQIIVSTSPRREWGRNMPWADGLRGWRRNQVSAWTFFEPFANPDISPDKDGHMFCGADLKDRARKKAEVTAIYLLSFDSDTGQPDSDIIPRLQAAGHAFVKYTSHSNGKTNDAISLRALRKFDSTIGDIPTDDDLRRYLAGKRTKDGDIGSGRGYWPTLAASAKITSIVGEGDAMVVEFEHKPIHKYRVIMPLATPFVVTDENRSRAESEWKAVYTNMAETLGIWFDPACVDLARAFYLGRAKTLESYNCVVGGSAPLELPTVTPEMLARIHKDQPPRAKSGKKAKPGAKFGQDVRQEYYINREEFDVVNWLRAAGCETVGWGDHDKQTIICPNVDEHTEDKPDDQGCVAISPAISDCGLAIITCLHGHCRNMRTDDHLEMICEGLVADDPIYPVPLISDHLMYFVDSFESTAEEPAETATPAAGGAKKSAAKFDSLKRLLKGTKDLGFKVESTAGVVQHKAPGDDYPQTVCDAFDVLGKAHDDGDSAWGFLLEIQNPKKDSRRVVVTESEVHGDNKKMRSKLAHNGLHIEYGGVLFEKLMMSLKPTNYVMIAAKPGWTADKTRFVCPDGTVIGGVAGEALTVLLDNPITDQVAGTLAGQQAAWKIAFTHGAPHHFLMCLGGVAGAVVEYAGFDSTPILMLSGTSSVGKTSALMLGAGGFGNTDIKKPGLLHTLRLTDNRLENIAEKSNGTGLFLDETAQFSGSIQQLIFLISGGAGKGRMRSDSTDQRMRHWASFCGLTSEHAAKDLVEEQTSHDANVGFSARVADVDCSSATPLPEPEYLAMMSLIKENYGHIGPAFVKHIIASADSPETMRERIEAKAIALAGEGASALLWRAAGVFAVLWEVGEMLGAAELLPDSMMEGEGAQRIRDIWQAYHSSDEAKALSPGRQAIEKLGETLVARMGVDVQEIDADARSYKEAMAWFGKKESTVTFYVRVDKIAQLAGGTMKQRALVAGLKASGILTPMSDKNLAWDKIPGGFKMQHYRLTFQMEPVEVRGPFAG